MAHRIALSPNAAQDMAFGEFRRQLTYKVAMRGGQLIVADSGNAASCVPLVDISLLRYRCPLVTGLAPYVGYTTTATLMPRSTLNNSRPVRS